jgi:hypothetical protein
MKEYERAYNIQRTDRSSIFFFAVETSGGLGKEAREFVKLLAKMSGGDLSSTTLGFIRHWQWSFKRRELSRSTLQTEDMPPTLHHFLHLVFFILFLLLFILLLFLLLLLLLFHFSILG